jgi:hypothetical protein
LPGPADFPTAAASFFPEDNQLGVFPTALTAGGDRDLSAGLAFPASQLGAVFVAGADTFPGEFAVSFFPASQLGTLPPEAGDFDEPDVAAPVPDLLPESQLGTALLVAGLVDFPEDLAGD